MLINCYYLSWTPEEEAGKPFGSSSLRSSRDEIGIKIKAHLRGKRMYTAFQRVRNKLRQHVVFVESKNVLRNTDSSIVLVLKL